MNPLLVDAKIHTQQDQKMPNHGNEFDDLKYISTHDVAKIMGKAHFVININQLIYNERNQIKYVF